jgi:alpha-galactosidase
VRNSLTRAWMHRRLWLNDPDALILREAGSDLSDAEVRSLATVIALSGGACMLGDDLPALEVDRQPLSAHGLGPHGDQPQVLDLLSHETPGHLVVEQDRPWGRGWIVALFNWEGRPADLSLELSLLGIPAEISCHLHEFWSRTYRRVRGTVRFANVEAHGCRAFLLHPVGENVQWVGSTLHLVQGREIERWNRGTDDVSVTLRTDRWVEGNLLFWFPRGRPHKVECQAGTADLELVEQGVWQLHVRRTEIGPWHISLSGSAAPA